MARPAKFNGKSFVSFLVLFYIIILTITGIVLYFSPPGRVANWVEWRFLGLTKTGWQSVHTIFSFTFVVLAGFHLYYNWVVFWSYLKSKVQAGIKMKRELILSGSFTSIILVLTILNFPPFSSVMQLGDYLSESWSNESTEPPIPHAELLTVKDYAQKTDLSLYKALQNLHLAGLKGIDSLAVIGDIAQLNGLTPNEVALKLSNQTIYQQSVQQYFGFGRMTINQVSKELKIEPGIAIDRLKNSGLKFSQDQILKKIAEENNLKPLDIVNIIKGEDQNEGGEHL